MTLQYAKKHCSAFFENSENENQAKRDELIGNVVALFWLGLNLGKAHYEKRIN